MKHMIFETLDGIEKRFAHNKYFNCQTFTRTVYSATIKNMNHATFNTFPKLEQFLSKQVDLRFVIALEIK